MASKDCNIVCPGDNEEHCGGENAAIVGKTNILTINITSTECRRECAGSSSCKGVFFTENTTDTTCAAISSPLLRECTSKDSAGLVFIQSFERYYKIPWRRYLSFNALHKSKEHSIHSCEKLCDSFFICDGIRFKENSATYNCEILTGGKLDPKRSEADRDIYLVNESIKMKTEMKISIFILIDWRCLKKLNNDIFIRASLEKTSMHRCKQQKTGIWQIFFSQYIRFQ